jgi:hypothetical protein
LTGNPLSAAPISRRALDGEVVRPQDRSWFYRVFVAPFIDVDDRVHLEKLKRARQRR